MCIRDSAEHIDAGEVPQLGSHSGEALGEYLAAGKLHMICHLTESEVGGFMLHEVCPEALLLRGYPGQRQADRQYHTGSGLSLIHI